MAVCGLSMLVYAAALHVVVGRCLDVLLPVTPTMRTGADYAVAALFLTGLAALTAGTTLRCAAPPLAPAVAYVLTGMLLTLLCWLLVPLLQDHAGALPRRTAHAVDRLADVLPYAHGVFIAGGLLVLAAVWHLDPI